MIRELTLTDAPRASALLAAVNPEFVTTAESVRHNIATSPPEAKRRWWCAEEDGTIVGYGSLGLVPETSDKGAAWISVLVHPEHRRRGLGSELTAATLEHAHAIEAVRLHCWSRSDDDTTAFARSQGFEQNASHDLLAVDPRTVAPPELPAGVELRPFTAYENDPTPVHHVDSVSAVDEPGELTFDEITYDMWLETFWSHPLLDHDASMVALQDGVPATVTFLQTDRDTGRATNNGTGTLREYRGRGLATLAKQASLACAAGLGITAVYTGNDVTNAPMQAINRKLGYAPAATMLSWARDLVTT